MATSLLELPIELIDNIFSFCDEKSLLEMRKVSKFTKELAEATVLNRSDAPDIEVLKLIGEAECQVSFKFNFDSKNKLRSKLFLVSAINYLQITGFKYRSKKMFATMSPSETTSFFQRLTPLMRNGKCNAFAFYPSTPETLSRTSTFFEGKPVGEIAVSLKDLEQTSDAEYLLQVVAQFQPTHMHLTLDNSIFHAAEFLIQIAGMIDVLTFEAPVTVSSNRNWILASIQRLSHEILSRRCSYLNLSYAFSQISLNEAKEIAMILGGIHWKNIKFSLPTLENSPLVDNTWNQLVAVVEDKNFSSGHRIEIGNLKWA